MESNKNSMGSKIEAMFAGLGKSVDAGSIQKMTQYAERIKNGESRDKVFEGLGDSFKSGTEDILALMDKETNKNSSEKKETTITVEQKGKGFTIVDENRDNYLWQDEHGQVLWTKDKTELDAAKKVIEEKINREKSPSNEPTLEDIAREEKEIKEALAKKKQEEEDKVKERAELVEKKENLVVEKETEKQEENKEKDTSKETAEEKEEKIDEIKEEINTKLAEKIKRSKELLEQARGGATYTNAKAKVDTYIENARGEYISKYDTAVKSADSGAKVWHKVLNSLGLKSKDAYTRVGAGYGSEEKRVAYENLKNEREATLGAGLGFAYANEKLSDREAETKRFFEQNKSEERRKVKSTETFPEYQKRLQERYIKMLSSKMYREGFTSESKVKGFSEVKFDGLLDKQESLDFVKQENENLRKEKKAVQEKHKSSFEKGVEKAGKWAEKNPWFGKTVGNKWFRFALTTGTIGLATGGMSTFFLANRAARFAGGIVGGRVGKWIGDKTINEANILTKKLATLEKDYLAGKMSASDFDDKREKIDLVLNRYGTLKKAMTGAGALGGGYAGSGVEHLVQNNIDFTTTAPVEETPTNSPKFDPHAKDSIDQNAPLNKEQSDALKNLQKNAVEGNDTTQNGTVTPPDSIQNHIENTNTTTTPVETTTPAEIQDDWKITKGEGIEHSFIRQIEHNDALAKQLGWHEGFDKHAFAQKWAHKIAIQEGYVNADGSERWVYNVQEEPAYELRMENGGVGVHEYTHGVEKDLIDQSNDTFETDLDKADNGTVYEKLHSHHATHTSGAHYENTSHHSTHHEKNTVTHSVAPKQLEEAELPPSKPTLEHAELPGDTKNLPKAELPQDLHKAPVRLYELPQTHGDPTYRTPGYNPETDAGGGRGGGKDYNANPTQNGGKDYGTSSIENQNLSNNNLAYEGASGKSFWDHLFDGLFGGSDATPHIPSTPEGIDKINEGIA